MAENWSEESLAALTRKELQALAKQHGVKANGKSADIVSALLEVLATSTAANETGVSPEKKSRSGSSIAQEIQITSGFPNTVEAEEQKSANVEASGAPTRRSSARRSTNEEHPSNLPTDSPMKVDSVAPAEPRRSSVRRSGASENADPQGESSRGRRNSTKSARRSSTKSSRRSSARSSLSGGVRKSSTGGSMRRSSARNSSSSVRSHRRSSARKASMEADKSQSAGERLSSGQQEESTPDENSAVGIEVPEVCKQEKSCKAVGKAEGRKSGGRTAGEKRERETKAASGKVSKPRIDFDKLHAQQFAGMKSISGAAAGALSARPAGRTPSTARPSTTPSSSSQPPTVPASAEKKPSSTVAKAPALGARSEGRTGYKAPAPFVIKKSVKPLTAFTPFNLSKPRPSTTPSSENRDANKLASSSAKAKREAASGTPHKNLKLDDVEIKLLSASARRRQEAHTLSAQKRKDMVACARQLCP